MIKFKWLIYRVKYMKYYILYTYVLVFKLKFQAFKYIIYPKCLKVMIVRFLDCFVPSEKMRGLLSTFGLSYPN